MMNKNRNAGFDFSADNDPIKLPIIKVNGKVHMCDACEMVPANYEIPNAKDETKPLLLCAGCASKKRPKTFKREKLSSMITRFVDFVFGMFPSSEEGGNETKLFMARKDASKFLKIEQEELAALMTIGKIEGTNTVPSKPYIDSVVAYRRSLIRQKSDRKYVAKQKANYDGCYVCSKHKANVTEKYKDNVKLYCDSCVRHKLAMDELVRLSEVGAKNDVRIDITRIEAANILNVPSRVLYDFIKVKLLPTTNDTPKRYYLDDVIKLKHHLDFEYPRRKNFPTDDLINLLKR